MKWVRNIAAILLAAVILGESLGMLLVRDLCVPCQSESLAVVMPLDEYEENCVDCCHEETACPEDHCCTPVHHDQEEHQHQQDVQFFSKNPDFLKQNIAEDLSQEPAVLTIFNLQGENLAIQEEIHKNELLRKEELPPDNDPRALLCTYLI